MIFNNVQISSSQLKIIKTVLLYENFSLKYPVLNELTFFVGMYYAEDLKKLYEPLIANGILISKARTNRKELVFCRNFKFPLVFLNTSTESNNPCDPYEQFFSNKPQLRQEFESKFNGNNLVLSYDKLTYSEEIQTILVKNKRHCVKFISPINATFHVAEYLFASSLVGFKTIDRMLLAQLAHKSINTMPPALKILVDIGVVDLLAGSYSFTPNTTFESLQNTFGNKLQWRHISHAITGSLNNEKFLEQCLKKYPFLNQYKNDSHLATQLLDTLQKEYKIVADLTPPIFIPDIANDAYNSPSDDELVQFIIPSPLNIDLENWFIENSSETPVIELSPQSELIFSEEELEYPDEHQTRVNAQIQVFNDRFELIREELADTHNEDQPEAKKTKGKKTSIPSDTGSISTKPTLYEKKLSRVAARQLEELQELQKKHTNTTSKKRKPPEKPSEANKKAKNETAIDRILAIFNEKRQQIEGDQHEVLEIIQLPIQEIDEDEEIYEYAVTSTRTHRGGRKGLKNKKIREVEVFEEMIIEDSSPPYEHIDLKLLAQTLEKKLSNRNALIRQPRNHQVDALNALVKHFTNELSHGYFEVATGGGKSYLAAFLMKAILEYSPGAKILVVTPILTLLPQLSREFKNAGFDERQMQQYDCNHRNYSDEKPVTITTYKSFNNKQDFDIESDFDLIIFDEAHRAASKSSYNAIANLIENTSEGKYNKKRPILIGFSATPGQARTLFEHQIFYYSTAQAIRDGALVPFSCNYIIPHFLKKFKSSDDTCFSNNLSFIGSSKFDEEKWRFFAKILADNYANGIDPYGNPLWNSKTLVFVPSIAIGEFVTEIFNSELQSQANGQTLMGFVSSNDQRKRKQYTDEFITGKIRLLCNVHICAEGFDVPDAQNVILLGDCSKQAADILIQQVGRVLRTCQNKHYANIYHYVTGGNSLYYSDIVPELDFINSVSDKPRINIATGLTRSASTRVKILYHGKDIGNCSTLINEQLEEARKNPSLSLESLPTIPDLPATLPSPRLRASSPIQMIMIEEAPTLYMGQHSGFDYTFEVIPNDGVDNEDRGGSCGFLALNKSREEVFVQLVQASNNPRVRELIGQQIRNDFYRERNSVSRVLENELYGKLSEIADRYHVAQRTVTDLQSLMNESDSRELQRSLARAKEREHATEEEMQSFLNSKTVFYKFLNNSFNDWAGHLMLMAWATATNTPMRIWHIEKAGERKVFIPNGCSYLEGDLSSVHDIIHTGAHFEKLKVMGCKNITLSFLKERLQLNELLSTVLNNLSNNRVRKFITRQIFADCEHNLSAQDVAQEDYNNLLKNFFSAILHDLVEGKNNSQTVYTMKKACADIQEILFRKNEINYNINKLLEKIKQLTLALKLTYITSERVCKLYLNYLRHRGILNNGAILAWAVAEDTSVCVRQKENGPIADEWNYQSWENEAPLIELINNNGTYTRLENNDNALERAEQGRVVSESIYRFFTPLRRDTTPGSISINSPSV